MVRKTFGRHHLYAPLLSLLFRSVRLTTVRDFDKNDAKAWWPVSALLVAVIYTGSKSLVSRLHCPSAASEIELMKAIPSNPSLHNLQELDHHPNRTCRHSLDLMELMLGIRGSNHV